MVQSTVTAKVFIKHKVVLRAKRAAALERGRHALAPRGYCKLAQPRATNMSAKSLVQFERATCTVLAAVQPAVQQHHHDHTDVVTVAPLDLQAAPGSVQP